MYLPAPWLHTYSRMLWWVMRDIKMKTRLAVNKFIFEMCKVWSAIMKLINILLVNIILFKNPFELQPKKAKKQKKMIPINLFDFVSIHCVIFLASTTDEQWKSDCHGLRYLSINRKKEGNPMYVCMCVVLSTTGR